MTEVRDRDPEALIQAAEERGRQLAERLAATRAPLPLRYWRQAAHLTTPASDGAMARKAIEGGTAAVGRILERHGLSPADLADRLEVPPALVERLLAGRTRAPMVMLDAEDAVAPGEEVAQRSLGISVELLRSADWGDGPDRSLRSFRPPGLGTGMTARTLHSLLWRLAGDVEGAAADLAPSAAALRFPLDAIVMPKVEHPDEVDLVHGWLDDAEHRLGLPHGTIRCAYLIESGWAISQLPAIARRAAPRLCALIFGLADLSADLALPAMTADHPVSTWARVEMVAVAGAVGVPAVDGMTLAYPVADPSLGAAANRERFLARMRLVFDDTLAARALGMYGKWVGHPAQLLAVLLADEVVLSPERLEAEAARIETYRIAVEAGLGATVIDGSMSDRATDRHARVLLRRATAAGRLDIERALALRVIDADEADELRGTGAAAGVASR